MGAVVIHWFIRIASLSWLTGPIFDKELRVSSRRRRSYVLRFTYVVFFALLVALVWLEAVPRGSTGLFQASRMAEAGQAIVTFVVWFQFIASQVVAIVMLSTAISDEIYSKTLGLLMTTPVGSVQIVLGKLLSKLLQLMLLLTITLPLLAIVRVFGGVPWDFLVCGLSITLTTAMFLGTLSLFFSIFTRRAHTVIIVTVLTAGVLFPVPRADFSAGDCPCAFLRQSISHDVRGDADRPDGAGSKPGALAGSLWYRVGKLGAAAASGDDLRQESGLAAGDRPGDLRGR